MRNGSAAFAAVALVILAAFAAAPCIADGDEGFVTLCGFATDVSGAEGNDPLQNATVTFYSPMMKVVGTCLTDSRGWFEFTSPGNSIAYMSFTKEMYSIRMVSDYLVEVGDGGLYAIQFDKMTPVDGRYQIGNDYAVAMRLTTGIIHGSIFGMLNDNAGKIALSGAKITLKASNGALSYASTDSNGYFEIECYAGVYSVSASCNGFSTSENVIVSTDEDTFELCLKQKDRGVMFGLDTAHSLEIVGILSALVIGVLFVILVQLKKKKDDAPFIISDLDAAEEDEKGEK